MTDDVAQFVPTDNLQPNPLQPRGSITSKSLNDLTESIKQHGILEPLVVAQTPAGLQIIAGERRWRAAKAAGLTKVPALIKRTTPQGMLEMAIIENVQRSDLNPIDRAKAFDRLSREFNLSTTDIAKRVSKSPAYVSNTLRLLTLPDALTDGLISGDISEGHARALAAIDNTRDMIEAYKIVLKESASVRRAEELARRFKQHAKQSTNTKKDTAKEKHLSKRLDKIQSDLKSTLGKTSDVTVRQSNRQTKVIITLKGSPEKTDDLLDKIHLSLSQDN